MRAKMAFMDRHPEPWQPRVPLWVYDVVAVAVVLLVGGFFVWHGFRPGVIPVPNAPRGPVQGGGGPPGAFGGMSAGRYVWLHLPVLLSAAAVGVRRWWPYVAYGVTLACLIAVVLFGGPVAGPALALVIAQFGLANRRSRNTALVSGIVAAVVIVILSFAATHWGSPDLSLVVAVATVAIAAALGDSTRSRREYVVLLARRAFHAEQTREAEARRRVADERLRIARDLHDTVAHEISVISLNAGVASSALESSPERAQKALATIRSASRGALKEIGELLHYLRSDGEAATAPPRPILESLPELVTQMREGGLNVGLDIRGDVATVGPSASVVVYRIVQEGLTNAQKHGSGNSATVQVSITPAIPRDSAPSHVPFGIPGGTVRIVVTNPVDGVRRDVPGHGLGLVGIRERVAALGGHVTAGRVGNQWVVDAVVPTVDVR